MSIMLVSLAIWIGQCGILDVEHIHEIILIKACYWLIKKLLFIQLYLGSWYIYWFQLELISIYFLSLNTMNTILKNNELIVTKFVLLIFKNILDNFFIIM